MRRIHLSLIPLAGVLLACTGMCSGILEKIGIGDGGETTEGPDAPDGFRCTTGQVAGGDFPLASGQWWTFEESGETAKTLEAFWDFPPARAAMREGDAQWYCDDGGQWNGPYQRLSGEPEAWVKGYYESGDPHGTWRGGSGDDLGEDVTFEGPYNRGVKAGSWTFYADGEVVATGAYREDLPHGDWTYTSQTAEHSYRYIYGVRHGRWKEADPKDSSLRTGAWFNGKKHGVWIEQKLDEESGEMKEVKREVWELGTSRGADGRDPLSGEEGAREVLRAYLEADQLGGRLSSGGYRQYPVLSDFADATQFDEGDPTYDKAIITDKFTIKSVEVSGATAKIKVEFDEKCEIVAGAAVEGKRELVEVEFTLKQQEGFWRLDTPATVPHPSGRSYLSAAGGVGTDLADQIRSKCAPEREGKVGKGNRGEGRPGGRVGKGVKGNKGRKIDRP